MKHILLILLTCTAAISTLHAVDPVVVVRSATSVTVDGIDYGKPVDAIANNPQLTSPIQRALEVWVAGVVAAQAEAEAQRAAEAAKIRAILSARLTAELATGDGPKAALIREIQAALEE
jgi:hypothetical protein